MKLRLLFLFGAAFLACHAVVTAAQDTTTTDASYNSTEIDDESAFAKLFYAANATTAIKNSFIVAMNRTLVEDLNETVSLLATKGIVLDKLLSGMKMVRITVDATESGDDEDAAKGERKAKLLSWLKNSLIDWIEEVRAGKWLPNTLRYDRMAVLTINAFASPPHYFI